MSDSERGSVPMMGPSDKAIVGPCLAAAYPIIRADVIAEVVARLREAQPKSGGWEAADFIERELGGER